MTKKLKGLLQKLLEFELYNDFDINSGFSESILGSDWIKEDDLDCAINFTQSLELKLLLQDIETELDL